MKLSTKKKKNKAAKSDEAELIDGKLEIISMTPAEMELDFIGFHISLINAYRRIILAEVMFPSNVTLSCTVNM